MSKILIDSQSTFTIGQSILNDTSAIEVKGIGNSVSMGDNVKGRLVINILGNNSDVIIENNVQIFSTLEIVIRRGNSRVIVGADSTFQGLVRLYNHEPSSIIIGSDCMFAGDIMVSSSDMHAIFDINDVRINPAEAVFIGDHVWVGASVRILKGVTIGNGSIIGMSSLVTKGIYPEQCIMAGNPARMVRTGIRWTRNLP